MADYTDYSDSIEDDGDTQEQKDSSYVRSRAGRKRKKKRRIPIGKIIGAVFILFVLVYASMLIYTSNFTLVTTEEAVNYEVSDYLEISALAVRNEEYVESTKNGIIAYVIEDGKSVNVGGTVAKLFSTEEDVNNWQEYNSINDELTVLKQLSTGENNIFVDLDTVDSRISKNITSYRTAVQSNDFDDARQIKLDLLHLFNERAIVTNDASDFSERISELEAQLDEISVSDSIGSVRSKTAGTFVSAVDGYEKSIDYANVENLTVADIDEIVAKNPPSTAVGKVITTLNWYLLCRVDSDQALTVATGDSNVEISIPEVISGTIPGTVAAINQSSKADDGLLIIKCDYMNGDLANIREENINIRTKTYSGLRVPRKAIHEDTIKVYDYDENGNTVGEPREETVQGVYVMYGNRLTFVQVDIVYSGKEFVLCNPDTTNPNLLNGTTIALHDEIVVQGKDLYDGKIIK